MTFLSSYIQEINAAMRQRCQNLIDEADAIKAEFESIDVEDFDNRHKKDEEIDTNFDFNQAMYKEELELEEDNKRHDAFLHAVHYPQVVFESIFLTIYSHFERHLHSLCEIARERDTLLLGPNDITGKGIQRSLKYLKKVARINLPENIKEWGAILQLQKVRNIIVHDPEYDFEPYNEKSIDPKLRDFFWLRDYDQDEFFEKSGINVDSDELMFSAESIDKVIQTLSLFLETIHKKFEHRDSLREKFRKGSVRAST